MFGLIKYKEIPVLELYKREEKPVVLHVSTPMSWRGGEQQMIYLVEELKEKGVVQIVLCPPGSKVAAYCLQQDIDHICCKKRFSLDPFFALEISRLCKHLNIQVIHCHDSHAHSLAFLASVLWKNKTPMVISRRVDFPIKKSFLSRLKYNSSYISRIVCVSDKIKEITAPDIRNKNVLTTVHSGIDVQRFSQPLTENVLRKEFCPEAEVLIGNVAALAPHKDYFTFIDTIQVFHSKHPDVKAHFFAIGSGKLEHDLKTYAEEKKVDHLLTFTGFREDINFVLKSLDVFLITSETEGLGTSILDAIACGVPVVATQAGGIPEIIQHEETGLSSPIKSPELLTDNLYRLMQEPELRQQLIQNATKRLEQFKKEHVAKRTWEIYQEIWQS